MNLFITEFSKDLNMFKEVLIRIDLSVRCCTRLIDVEGYEIAELSEATVKNLQTAIMNVNKTFVNSTASTRIYFPPTRITKIKELCVYIKRYIMIIEIPCIRLIATSNIQEMVACLDSQIVEADDIDDIIKQKELKSDPRKFKIFRDDLTTLICATR